MTNDEVLTVRRNFKNWMCFWIARLLVPRRIQYFIALRVMTGVPADGCPKKCVMHEFPFLFEQRSVADVVHDFRHWTE